MRILCSGACLAIAARRETSARWPRSGESIGCGMFASLQQSFEVSSPQIRILAMSNDAASVDDTRLDSRKHPQHAVKAVPRTLKRAAGSSHAYGVGMEVVGVGRCLVTASTETFALSRYRIGSRND
jgi:hypothetical protein